MKWYEYRNPKSGEIKWWTQRDKNGVCFEVREDGGKFRVFACDLLVRTFHELQSAINYAEGRA